MLSPPMRPLVKQVLPAEPDNYREAAGVAAVSCGTRLAPGNAWSRWQTFSVSEQSRFALHDTQTIRRLRRLRIVHR